MEPSEEQLIHLRRLAEELAGRDFTAEVSGPAGSPYLKVTNPGHPRLSERVLCRPAPDGTWCFWWPWRQPIGAVDDVATVIQKITTVLRSVEGTP
jgi:hypothetical protein